MKKFFQLCGILLLASALFAISAIGMPHLMPEHVRPTPAPVFTPPPEVITIDEPYHAIVEYGTSEVIKNNNGPLFAYIRFPQGGNPTDQTISEWAHDIYDTIAAEFETVQSSEPNAIGEINIHFDSFLVDNRYAGIFENGQFSHSIYAPPEEVVKTFNIDLTRNVFLETTDILDFSKSDDILDLLHERLIAEHPDTERHIDYIDESWLYHLVIGHDGINVVLERFMFLPETFPTLTVTLPYDDLGSALLIRTQPPLDAPPASQPTEEPPDDPSPGPDDEPDDTVSQVPPQSGNIDPSKPMIALSFDDGPGIYTNDFLDLFEQYGVRATFCTIGNLVNTQTAALTRAVSMGSEVIGHSWDHKNLAKLSYDDVKTQIIDTSNVIQSATGAAPVAKFRPPYGEISDTMKEVAADLGYAIILWSVDPEDWNTKDSDAVYNAVMQHAIDGAIVLSHEIYKSTLAAYQRIIPDLLSQGYQLVTVSELLYYKHGDLTPGGTYGGRFG